MKTTIVALSVVAAFALVLPAEANGSRFVAFSLCAAQTRLEAGQDSSEPLRFGDITHLEGMVIDPSSHDVILVGIHDPQEAPLNLQDFAVALRSRLELHHWPLISLDRTEETVRTNMLKVRFEGGIEQTRIGRFLLDADVTLKHLALGTSPAELWGVRSYADLCNDAARNGDTSHASVLFWFFPMNYCGVDKDGVCSLTDINVGTTTQLIKPKDNRAGYAAEDPMGKKFAHDMTAAYDDLAQQFPELRRVRQIYTLVAVAYAIETDPTHPDLVALLRQIPLDRVPTPVEFPILTSRGSDVSLTGGVQLHAMIRRLRDGDVTAMRDVVLRSRPSPSTLCWEPPLANWRIPAGRQAATDSEEQKLDESIRHPGCNITRQSPIASLRRQPELPQPFTLNSYTPPSVASPGSLTLGRNIGGVMLSGTAHIPGATNVNLQSGGFSFVVDGQNAELSPESFDRFVTALWAVYYCHDVPGLSIDPIGPGVNKHMVRYIGQVINSDLGRVLRESDYTMKKWAVGTERPDVQGFENPHDWLAHHGGDLYACYRRFWFVPEDLNFRVGNGMLLYSGGNMRLRTEVMDGNGGGHATQQDQQFADFVTGNYTELSRKYPIYGDLFEYAKMVALARYLKQQQVPLHWFLMANREHVLTEDSPSTVLELAKKSEHFEGVEIRGGVSLEAGGHYIQDATSLEAIATAMRNGSSQPLSQRPAVSAPGAMDATSPAQYTAIPQTSLTSGRDRNGIRYQTDAAFACGQEPGLQIVRYYNTCQTDRGMFGNGWELLLPYVVTTGPQMARTKIQEVTVALPAAMHVHNLLNGTDEELGLDNRKYKALGYVPREGAKTLTLGLFVTQGGLLGAADGQVPACRLADKLGNEFRFDGRGLMVGMDLGEEHSLAYTYARAQTRTIVRPTVTLQSVSGEAVEIEGYHLPKRLCLTDAIGRKGLVLAADERGIFRPESHANPHVRGLVWGVNGTRVLCDDWGNQIHFTSAGAVEAIDFSEETHVVQSMAHQHLKDGAQTAEFEYTVDLTGMLRVGRARITLPAPSPSMVLGYEYDENGYLTHVSTQRP